MASCRAFRPFDGAKLVQYILIMQEKKRKSCIKLSQREKCSKCSFCTSFILLSVRVLCINDSKYNKVLKIYYYPPRIYITPA